MQKCVRMYPGRITDPQEVTAAQLHFSSLRALCSVSPRGGDKLPRIRLATAAGDETTESCLLALHDQIDRAVAMRYGDCPTCQSNKLTLTLGYVQAAGIDSAFSWVTIGSSR